MLVVLRIGGSVIASPINTKLIDQYSTLLRKLVKNGHRIMVVVGGGTLAREFIREGDKLGLDRKQKDWIAIHVSRLHALLLSSKLTKNARADQKIPTSLENAIRILEKDKVVIMGGLAPGMTTDSVAAKFAVKTNSQLLVKATDQNGIYNKDPRKYKNAKKLDKVTYRDLTHLLEQDSHEAGIHQILDPVALNILRDTKIKTMVVNGYDPENIRKAIEGEDVGTTISS
jgi:uridylate kinase